MGYAASIRKLNESVYATLRAAQADKVGEPVLQSLRIFAHFTDRQVDRLPASSVSEGEA